MEQRVTRQTFIPPDPVQLRDALRGLRFFLRRGGETIAETLNVEALPKPASNLVGVVLREVDGLARSVDGIASDMAKTLLGGHKPQVAQLDDLIAQPNSESVFAAAFYVALTSVLRRLGASSVFVSEAAARSAIDMVSLRESTESTTGYGARLTLALLEARVIRGTTAQQAALVPGAALEPVSIFAVMLWIQSERSEAENEAALNAATDMAVALAPEVSIAFYERDGNRIKALFTRYVPHV
jgi:hypothetical protein